MRFSARHMLRLNRYLEDHFSTKDAFAAPLHDSPVHSPAKQLYASIAHALTPSSRFNLLEIVPRA